MLLPVGEIWHLLKHTFASNNMSIKSRYLLFFPTGASPPFLWKKKKKSFDLNFDLCQYTCKSRGEGPSAPVRLPSFSEWPPERTCVLCRMLVWTSSSWVSAYRSNCSRQGRTWTIESGLEYRDLSLYCSRSYKFTIWDRSPYLQDSFDS